MCVPVGGWVKVFTPCVLIFMSCVSANRLVKPIRQKESEPIRVVHRERGREKARGKMKG